ncbi:MAG: hypothetical protein HY332_17860 [Chloroflexi bacterium]|nr:hypothetical protein [Chloroflexota bacterium]
MTPVSVVSAVSLRDARYVRMEQVLRLGRPDRLPSGDYASVEYRPDVYHLGTPEFVVEPGQVGVSRDGKKRFTRDGGVWAVGDAEQYKDHEDVLGVDLERFEVEPVGPAMLDEMARLLARKAETHFPVPLQYGTLFTRATMEFGWEPMLLASAIDPDAFGRILDRFGEASLAVVQGWCRIDGTRLLYVHDDIAGTRGPLMRPEWYRKYVFPWYRRLFDAIHEGGRKALYMCDGNYLPILDDVLATEPDGLYIESSSMDPGEFMRRAGKDKLYLIKSDSRNVDFGTPEEIYQELRKLRELHEEFPGMMMYRGGGNPPPGNAEAFARYYETLLVYR